MKTIKDTPTTKELDDEFDLDDESDEAESEDTETVDFVVDGETFKFDKNTPVFRKMALEENSKQQVASRKNGKLGGVKTSNGKAIASRNATKYGLYSNNPHELDQNSYQPIYDELAAKYKDTDPFRKALIKNMAIIIQRIDRCHFFELDFLNEQLNPTVVKKVKNPESMEAQLMEPELYVKKVVHQGSVMTIPMEKLEQLATIYDKIEGSLLTKLIKLHKALTQNDI